MKHDEMEAIGKKKYQVAVQLLKVEYYAVWAENEEAAGIEVTNGRFGTVLGAEGPAVINVAAKEIDPRVKDEEIEEEIRKSVEEPEKPSLIQVVGR